MVDVTVTMPTMTPDAMTTADMCFPVALCFFCVSVVVSTHVRHARYMSAVALCGLDNVSRGRFVHNEKDE